MELYNNKMDFFEALFLLFYVKKGRVRYLLKST